MDSILNSVKRKLGILEKQTEFDDGILIDYINSVFMILYQLGVGPRDKPYYIEDEGNTWDEFVDDGTLESVKSYVGMKCRLMFDPPQVGALSEALKLQIAELEWRLNVMVDRGTCDGKQ